MTANAQVKAIPKAHGLKIAIVTSEVDDLLRIYVSYESPVESDRLFIIPDLQPTFQWFTAPETGPLPPPTLSITMSIAQEMLPALAKALEESGFGVPVKPDSDSKG